MYWQGLANHSFQLNPNEFDFDTTIYILVKALTAVPFADFSLCISLLGEAPVGTLTSNDSATSTGASGIITEPVITHLATLSTLLFEAKFRDFWALYQSAEYADVRTYTSKAHGFEDAVRKVALNTVQGTFRTISTSRLASYLNLPESDLAAFLGKQTGWTLSNGSVQVPVNPDNDVKPTVVRGEASLESTLCYTDLKTCPNCWRRHSASVEIIFTIMMRHAMSRDIRCVPQHLPCARPWLGTRPGEGVSRQCRGRTAYK